MAAEIIYRTPESISAKINAVDLSAENFSHIVNPKLGGQIEIADDTLNDGNGGFRQGQVFVKMPEQLSTILPGSVITPAEFIPAVKQPREDGMPPSIEYHTDALTGAYEARLGWSPVFTAESETGKNTSFKLKVYNGATSKNAVKMSVLATAGFTDPTVRALYQETMNEVMEPILAKANGYTLRIVEDCIASGDTIAGFLAEAINNPKLLNLDTGRIRIDVAAATAQGILVLKKFAEDNHLDIEINVGHIAFSLSEGVPSQVADSPARVHANYITYPDFMKNESMQVVARRVFAGLPEEISLKLLGLAGATSPVTPEVIAAFITRLEYVVGDMGDAAKGISSEDQQSISELLGRPILPWNNTRKDPHGDHPLAGELTNGTVFDGQVVDVVFANGGYLLDALITNGDGVPKKIGTAYLTGKRCWSKEGYGVIVSGIKIAA